MKKLLCGVVVAALLGCSFVAGGLSNRAAAENKHEPQVLRVKAIEVVDDQGNVTCTLGSFNGTSGLWVGDQHGTGGQVASLIKEPGRAPYLGFLDTNPKNKNCFACSLALTTDADGKPVAQIVGQEKGDVHFVDLTKLPKMAIKK